MKLWWFNLIHCIRSELYVKLVIIRHGLLHLEAEQTRVPESDCFATKNPIQENSVIHYHTSVNSVI